LENYFAEVKIKNDHMIDKMEDRVKHAVNKYDETITVKPKQMEALCHVLNGIKTNKAINSFHLYWCLTFRDF